LIEGYKKAQPGAHVFLVGKSGGAGVIVRALELLGEAAVERVVLLAPALSPSYDLSQALCGVRSEMVVFWSPLDVFLLGLGTLVFGTMDRVRTVGAGLVGFAAPQRGDREGAQNGAYGKLRQVRWQPAMIRSGYLGGHFGPDCPLFLKKYVVPLLRPDLPLLRPDLPPLLPDLPPVLPGLAPVLPDLPRVRPDLPPLRSDLPRLRSDCGDVA
jgi:hypothetical protein